MKTENIIAYGSYILISIVSIVFDVLSHGTIDVTDQMIFLMVTVIFINYIRDFARRDK
jgi:hypothetical protein